MNALRMPICFPARILALAALMAVAPLATASAQIADEAAARLKAYAADQGLTVEWEEIEASGDDAVLVGVRAGSAGTMTPIGDVRLDGVSRDGKGYRIKSMSLPWFRAADPDEGIDFNISDVKLGDVLVPEESLRDYYGGSIFYRQFDVGGLSLNLGGMEVFSLGDVHFEATEPDAGTAMDFSGAAESFTLDLSLMEDQDQLAVIDALGLRQLKGYLEVEGSWNPNDGRLELAQYDIAVVDAGTLGLTLDIDGATPDLIGSMREMVKKMNESGGTDDPAQGLAVLGLMQQLTFNSAEIGFVDDALTGKVLDYVARNQGMKPADIANQAKAVVPFVLAQLNNPELTAQASRAIAAFLDDPQSLTVSARPAEPVPFALIFATAMTTPVELTKSLGVTVTAND